MKKKHTVLLAAHAEQHHPLAWRRIQELERARTLLQQTGETLNKRFAESFDFASLRDVTKP